MPLVKLSDLPAKIPDANDLVLIESSGGFYSTTVADFLPPFITAPPINLSATGGNVYLAPGESAYKNFTNASSVSLPISVAGGAIYNIVCFVKPTTSTTGLEYLMPNGVPINNGFSFQVIYTSSSWSTSSFSGVANGLVLAENYGSFYAVVLADSAAPKSISFGDRWDYSSSSPVYTAANVTSYLSSGTLTWTTLGTLVLTGASDGVVFVRREV